MSIYIPANIYIQAHIPKSRRFRRQRQRRPGGIGAIGHLDAIGRVTRHRLVPCIPRGVTACMMGHCGVVMRQPQARLVRTFPHSSVLSWGVSASQEPQGR